jgi:hypothetical protein
MAKSSRLLVRFIILLVLGGCILALYAARDDLKPYVMRMLAGEGKWFAEQTPPIPSMPHIFDLGIVDANGDGRLDVFTSNHNYRQALLLADAQDRYRDVLTEWGMDQNRTFPGWEQSFTPPVIDKPGLYIYWLGEALTLRAYGLSESGPVTGTLRMFSKISVEHNNGFVLDQKVVKVSDSPIPQTIVKFSVKGNGQLDLSPLSRGVPTEIKISPDFPLSSIFVGNQKASPTEHAFSPFLRDRHGLAWVDINADGHLDTYISRGGVGGMIRKLPANLRQIIQDELFISHETPRFQDSAQKMGIEKKDCSGRHVKWVDFDQDGRLDLFVNCQDRGKSKGIFPKQLWRQAPDGGFHDVAMAVGLGLPDHELIDFIWLDLDDDGDIDLLTSEDKGFFLYRNDAGRFTSQFIFRPDFVRADIADLKGEVNNYWRFDGKLAAADFDADGDLDVFASSKRGNVLLLNEARGFRQVDPATLGLPPQSLLAIWVDYDNDGQTDLYTVPEGLYRQTRPGHFEATGMLVLPQNKYQAAIAHWYDRDNDGKRDLLLALNENASLWRWWQKPFKNKDDIHRWSMHAWHNVGAGNNWLQIGVAGPSGNRQSIGARVNITSSKGTQTQVVGIHDTSFFSQGHYRLYFGLGAHARASRITVRWSDGRTRELTDVEANRLLTIDYPRSPEQESQ